jgi:CrcB protein
MISNLLLVGTGGCLGSMLRYGISTGMKFWLPGYAASGTLIVNVAGSFLIGCLPGIPPDPRTISESVRLFFVVGLLGGLTTFSSLAYETTWLSRHHDAGAMAGLGHLSANVLVGLAAVWLGAWIVRSTPAP